MRAKQIVVRSAADPPEVDGNEFGGLITPPSPAWMDKAGSMLERLVAGQNANTIMARLAKGPIALSGDNIPYVPSVVTAQYRLTDYFLSTEGDVWQTIDLPVELAATELFFRGRDKGAANEIREVFAPDQLDMYQHLTDMLLCMEKYDVSYPFEVWDADVPVHLSLLNPRYVAVGHVENIGLRPLWLANPLGVDERLTKLPEPIQRVLGDPKKVRDNLLMVPLVNNCVDQVRGMVLPFETYPVAPLARTFRKISTRQALEEMVRAVIEGYKSQLWAFLLGDADHMPTPKEIGLLKATLNGARGDRTGFLVWAGNLKIEQHTPKPLDSLLGNETWEGLTKQIMRDRGISLRLIDGEVKQAENAPSPLDIRVLIERLKFRRARVLRWCNSFIRRYADKNGMKRPPEAHFREISLEIEDRIKNVLMPLAGAGYLSPETVLEEAQFDYETEIARKRESQKDAELWAPKATFAQRVVNPSASEKTVDSGTPGRTPDSGVKKVGGKPASTK